MNNYEVLLPEGSICNFLLLTIFLSKKPYFCVFFDTCNMSKVL